MRTHFFCLRIMQQMDGAEGPSCAYWPGALILSPVKPLHERFQGWVPDPQPAMRSGIFWQHSSLRASCDLVLHRPGFCLLCRCQALLGTAWTHFREKWSGLHPLSQASRHDAVASLQPLAEIQVDYS